MTVRAIANNDVVFIAWAVPDRLAGCLGFSVHRTDANGVETVLPAWVGFSGGDNADWQPKTTDVWPVQRFTWLDVTAARGGTYRYQVFPMIGAPDGLRPAAGIGTIDTVTVTPDAGTGFRAFFNRGILATQSLAHQLQQGPQGGPSGAGLMDAISTPGNQIRSHLSGQILDALAILLNRAAHEGGSCYAALYELNDPDLVARLAAAGASLHLILSNTGTDDATNVAARALLHDTPGVEIIDRMLGSGHIGHNKFMVYVDAAGQPQSVLTGSTNWTITGVCAQSNNTIVIDSTDLATEYKTYWDALRADNALQAPALRLDNQTRHDVSVGPVPLTLWFSPNTALRSKPSGPDAPQPVDQAELFDLISGARHAVLFLLFQPGSPSVLDAIAAAQTANPDLIVRGAVTDPNAVDQYNTQLVHRPGEIPAIVAAAAVNDQFGFWEKELLITPGGHAIIHDKIVVIDPFDAESVVVTGSHNLGYSASYKNDENLLIIKGNRRLSAAYAAAVIDLYDHYRWRYRLQQAGDQAWNGLDRTDSWQEKYFTDPQILAEMRFWGGGG